MKKTGKILKFILAVIMICLLPGVKSEVHAEGQRIPIKVGAEYKIGDTITNDGVSSSYYLWRYKAASHKEEIPSDLLVSSIVYHPDISSSLSF